MRDETERWPLLAAVAEANGKEVLDVVYALSGRVSDGAITAVEATLASVLNGFERSGGGS